ncbi:RcnB family protein, partial [Erwinia amylovora]|uniref:RcnB family protein n=1 Tax=Erwinia amylovora TaxID=552 RepID=UPI0020BF702D
PRRYRGGDYRVDDWRARGLDEPPRGAHWAYIDGTYVLIAAATGLITAIIVGNLSGSGYH